MKLKIRKALNFVYRDDQQSFRKKLRRIYSIEILLFKARSAFPHAQPVTGSKRFKIYAKILKSLRPFLKSDRFKSLGGFECVSKPMIIVNIILVKRYACSFKYLTDSFFKVLLSYRCRYSSNF